jgi:cysteinyl-tRNA synthetase
MKLYNSLTRQVAAFTPLHEGQIAIYSCGPTVYERAHIGNLASFIYADTLRRTLQAIYKDAKISHVMNITDVDDKTITSSQAAYPELEPMAALLKLTREYEKQFKKDLVTVGVDVGAITFVRATDFIPQMQSLIKELITAGIGYLTDDGVYFSIANYKAKGKTYGQLVEITAESTGAARVNNDEYDKDNIHDFALWKKQKPGEPAWDFDIDGHDLKGRPGWHIECSAMSVAQLGQPFDIHTGGVDLKFPHHENEIAQSTATSSEDTMAQLFFHSEHLLVDGKKMSKSLKNFYNLADITNKGFDPLAFRVLVLQAQYANQAHFSWENLTAASNRLQDIYAWADLRHQATAESMPTELDELVGSTKTAVLDAFSDDLNTPAALASLNNLMTYMTTIPIPGIEGKHTDGILELIGSLLGLPLDARPDISSEQKQQLRDRQKLREAKDWQASDELRAKLAAQGIGIRDSDNGAIWYREHVAESSTTHQ